MSAFFPQVERWRPLVSQTLAGVFQANPQELDRVQNAGLEVETLIDTVLALIQVESSGDPKAVGDGGASIGLLQLNFDAGTPQDQGYTGTKEGLLDALTNVKIGVDLFLHNLARYNYSLKCAVTAHKYGSITASPVGTSSDYTTKVIGLVQANAVARNTPPGAGTQAQVMQKAGCGSLVAGLIGGALVGAALAFYLLAHIF